MLSCLGVVHEGRPQKFGDFYPPPLLSAFVRIWLTPPSPDADVRICIHHQLQIQKNSV